MGNQDKEIGLNYVSKTFYELADFITDHGEEGQEDEPLKFKIYKDVEYHALSQALPLQLGDMRWSFPEFRQHVADAPAATTFTYELLSTLLYYTFGFSRHDTGNGAQWPFHRLVPSARCFFPTELYLWIPQMDSRPAGIYHYDNLHHRLALLRAGDYKNMLGDIMGADLTESSCILFVSAYFWKMAFRYRNFAYRLCSQEAGMVVGNALLSHRNSWPAKPCSLSIPG